jgi:hypothetical protein
VFAVGAEGLALLEPLVGGVGWNVLERQLQYCGEHLGVAAVDVCRRVLAARAISGEGQGVELIQEQWVRIDLPVADLHRFSL